jgi:hypothetical protein
MQASCLVAGAVLLRQPQAPQCGQQSANASMPTGLAAATPGVFKPPGPVLSCRGFVSIGGVAAGRDRGGVLSRRMIARKWLGARAQKRLSGIPESLFTKFLDADLTG